MFFGQKGPSFSELRRKIEQDKKKKSASPRLSVESPSKIDDAIVSAEPAEQGFPFKRIWQMPGLAILTIGSGVCLGIVTFQLHHYQLTQYLSPLNPLHLALLYLYSLSVAIGGSYLGLLIEEQLLRFSPRARAHGSLLQGGGILICSWVTLCGTIVLLGLMCLRRGRRNDIRYRQPRFSDLRREVDDEVERQ